jgi:hypothetical protein
MRTFVQIAGPLLTLIGVALSIHGTYLLTRWYFYLSGLGFLQTVLKFSWLLLTLRSSKAHEEVTFRGKMAESKRESKADSLYGIYFIFLGFVLQAFGTLLWGIDVVMGTLQRSGAFAVSLSVAGAKLFTCAQAGSW